MSTIAKSRSDKSPSPLSLFINYVPVKFRETAYTNHKRELKQRNLREERVDRE